MSVLVSIIIPCYNQAKYLNETLESVCKQTYTNWECIIVDDGSSDDSATIISGFTKKDPRFIYIYKENGGVSSARNLGIEKAKGNYLQFLDADDLLNNFKIEASLNELLTSEKKGVEIVISNFEMISHDSKKIFPPFCELDMRFFSVLGFLTKWNVSFSIQMQCGFFEASLFETIRFPENLSAQEDWVVWVQLFKKQDKFIFINKPLAYYRMNPESRMMTIGIDDNQLKVIQRFREILTYDEFYIFSSNLIEKYYFSDIKYRSRLNDVKKSNSYLTGLIVKKFFKTIGILKFSKFVFEKAIRRLLSR